MNILRMLASSGGRTKQPTALWLSRWRSLCRLLDAFARRNRDVRRTADGTLFRSHEGAQAQRAPAPMSLADMKGTAGAINTRPVAESNVA